MLASLREVGQRAVREFRKNLALAGSDAGGQRAAAIDTLIKTCLCRARHKPARLPDHPANKLVDLVPRNWRPARQQSAVAA